MLSNNLLDYFGEFLRVLEDIAVGVAGPNQFDGRFETEVIFAKACVPPAVAGDNSRIGVKRDTCESGRGTRRLAEEIDEDALFTHGVLVGQDADCSLFMQDAQKRASRLVLEDGRVAREAAIAIHERVDARIVERTRHVMQRKAVECVREGAEFPRADVAREIENAFASALAFEEIFMAVKDDVLLDVFFCVP